LRDGTSRSGDERGSSGDGEAEFSHFVLVLLGGLRVPTQTVSGSSPFAFWDKTQKDATEGGDQS
jgi:hypothetical protein